MGLRISIEKRIILTDVYNISYNSVKNNLFFWILDRDEYNLHISYLFGA